MFQVNCPGCFIYALPAAIKLHEQFKAHPVKIMALSTAFEDYELNTLENTRLLLASGSLVGETKKTLNKAGIETFPLKIPFDVAFDHLSKKDGPVLPEEVKKYCESLAGYSSATAAEKKMIGQQVGQYLAKKEYHAYTFDQNSLNGTPSWILFNKNFQMLYNGFGDKTFNLLTDKINKFLA